MYHLVFRRNKNGTIEGRLRIRAYQNTTFKQTRKLYETFYHLNGQHQFSAVTEGTNEPELVVETTENTTSSNTSDCEVDVTSSRRVWCYGSNDDPTCVFYAVTTYKYKCNYTLNEQEQISWIDDDYPGGWYEYEETVEEYENKHIIDSLQGYPCAQDVLKQISSIDEEVSNLIYNVFGKSKTVHLTFKGDTTLPYLQDGKLSSQGSSYGQNFGNFKILLNDLILRNASQEYILTTIIHEALHAFIYYEKFNKGDSIFNLTYPIYGQYNNNDPQHNLMAERFRNSMQNLLVKFNPSLDTSTARALVWAGLDKTVMWKTLSDTTSIRQLYWAERNVNDTVSYGRYKGTKCPN